VIGSLIAYGFDICMVGLFAQWFGYVGIAVSSFLTITLYAAMLLIGIRIAFGKGSFAEGKNILRILLLGAIAASVMALVMNVLSPESSQLFSQAVVQVLVAGSAGLLTYLLMASVLKVNYAGFFWTQIRRRMTRTA
jgi:hypothetical protein